ncbi:CPCC family cysteine-rich protein [Brevibacillus sp. 179-C8.2 HS]
MICEISFWKDDYGQYLYPDEEGRANVYSPRQGQDNFQKGD